MLNQAKLVITAQLIITGLAIIGTIVFSILNISSIALIVICLFTIILLRLSEISRLVFKGAGFETTIERAERVTAEAEKAIELLKVLSRNLSQAVIDLQGIQGRENAVIVFTKRVEFRTAIENNLLSLGIAPQQIAVMFQDFDVFLTADLLSRAIHFVPDSPEKIQLKAEIDSYSILPDGQAIRAIFQKYSALNPNADMLLDETERYRQTKRVEPGRIK